jgi:hypothetical protein
MNEALGVGFAIQAVETFVSVAAGVVGALYLAGSRSAVRLWTLRIATVGASVALAAGVGLAVFLAF